MSLSSSLTAVLSVVAFTAVTLMGPEAAWGNCTVKIDKQVSCDGGLTFVDVGFGDNVAQSCSANNGDPNKIVVRYVVANTNVGIPGFASCSITDSNPFIVPPAVPNFPLGQSVTLTATPKTCSDPLDDAEPNTATLSCSCSPPDGSISLPAAPGSILTDTAAFRCVGPPPPPPPAKAVFLVIDEDSIDNGNPPNFFSDRDVNDDKAEIGIRAQLRFFRDHVGQRIVLHTGQVGDEGWFAPKTIPSSWVPAGGLTGFVGNPSAPVEAPPPHGVGPGLGAPDGNGDRESLLDKVPDVTPLRAQGLKMLLGREVCAVVFDSDISINYGPLNGSLKGANLGTVAFKVLSVTQLTGFSSSSLPKVELEILDATKVCANMFELLTAAPAPTSSSEPADIVP